jgi:hypothetical protein
MSINSSPQKSTHTRITELSAESPTPPFGDGFDVFVKLADGQRFDFFTTNGETWAWTCASEAKGARSVCAELMRIWDDDGAFKAVATPAVEHIRARLQSEF